MVKKKIVKTMLIAAFITLALSVFIAPAFASLIPPAPNGVPTSSLPDMINTISSIILTLVGLIAVLFLIIGGFQYITASGNPDQVKIAKQTVMYSIIGIGVALLSWVVVQFVINSLK